MKFRNPPVNSLSLEFLTEFVISLEKLENDKTFRGVILTSVGACSSHTPPALTVVKSGNLENLDPSSWGMVSPATLTTLGVSRTQFLGEQVPRGVPGLHYPQEPAEQSLWKLYLLRSCHLVISKCCPPRAPRVPTPRLPPAAGSLS